MKIIIQSLDFVVGEKLRYFLEEHIQTLPQTTGADIERVEVILGEESSDLNETKFCAIRLVIPNNGYLVTVHAGNYEKAFIIALEDIKQQVRERDTRETANG